MSLFGFGKKGREFVDLAEKYRKQKEKEKSESSSDSDSSSQSSAPFPFFDLGAGSKINETSNEVLDISSNSGSEGYESSHEKRRKLAKRLSDMTTKLEDLSNQIYHLQQRIEVIERKLDMSKY